MPACGLSIGLHWVCHPTLGRHPSSSGSRHVRARTADNGNRPMGTRLGLPSTPPGNALLPVLGHEARHGLELDTGVSFGGRRFFWDSEPERPRSSGFHKHDFADLALQSGIRGCWGTEMADESPLIGARSAEMAVIAPVAVRSGFRGLVEMAELIGEPMEAHQKRIARTWLESQAREVVTIAPKGNHKTTTVALAGVHELLSNPDADVIVGADSERQANIALRRMKGFAQRPAIARGLRSAIGRCAATPAGCCVSSRRMAPASMAFPRR